MAIYIGGNNENYYFNFYLKQQASTTENKNIATINSNEITQAQYNILSDVTNTSGYVNGTVVCNFDLSVILSTVYGGNIVNLKNAMQSITNTGLIFNNNTSSFEVYNQSNLSNYINNSGLIICQYSNPQFTEIIVKFIRVNDVIGSQKVEITNRQAVLIQELVFNFSSTVCENRNYTIVYLYKDNNNYAEFRFNGNNKKFEFIKVVNGNSVIVSSNAQVFDKWQMINLMFGFRENLLFMTVLVSGKFIEEYSVQNDDFFIGIIDFYFGNKNVIGNEINAYVGSLKTISFYEIPYDKNLILGNLDNYKLPSIINNSYIYPNNFYDIDGVGNLKAGNVNVLQAIDDVIFSKEYINNINLTENSFTYPIMQISVDGGSFTENNDYIIDDDGSEDIILEGGFF